MNTVGAGFAGFTAGIDTLPLTAGGAAILWGGKHSDEDSRTMQGVVASGLSAARQKCEVFL